ncbi:hypothetical protein ACFV06_32590 [Streptomyces sp. NPDC059618]|uniref:hypothetical protein n=1 Tax=Streptomyces sp. NPDC059618 TaxID=3346887 RepID=UPI0036A38815
MSLPIERLPDGADAATCQLGDLGLPSETSEAEVAAVLAAVGVSLPRRSVPRTSFRTPLPAPEAAPHIVSEVEWV